MVYGPQIDFVKKKKMYAQLNRLPKPWKFYTTAGRNVCDILQVCLKGYHCHALFR